jgi:hypothetical protein
VVCYVVGLWVRGKQFGALLEICAQDQRIRFGRLVRGHTHEHLAVNVQRRLAIGRTLLCVSKLQARFRTVSKETLPLIFCDLSPRYSIRAVTCPRLPQGLGSRIRIYNSICWSMGLRFNWMSVTGGRRSMHDALLKSIFNLLFVILLGWAGYHWFETIQRILHFYNPRPIEDYWRVPEEFHNYQNFNLSVLWRPNNEHRILAPEIFFAVDMLVFHGQQLLPLAFNVLSYIGCWILLIAALHSDPRLCASTRRFGAVLSAIVIGWPGIAFVLSTPFLLQWTLMQFATCLSLVSLWRTKATSKSYLWAAILSALVGTYSSGNGMLLWPVLVVCAFVLELPRREIATLAASGLLAIVIYFIDYDRIGRLHIADLIRHPIYTFEFLCVYLSMPLGAERPNSFSLTVGSLCIALTCYFFWLAWRNRLVQSSTAGSVIWVLFICNAHRAIDRSRTDGRFSG